MDYPIVNVLANAPRGGTQSVDDKLDLLGRFATAGNVRSLLGTKLLINQQTGDFTLQESGLRTWWARSAADSLTNPAVHRHVTRLFENARAQVGRMGNNAQKKTKVDRILYAYKGYGSLVRQGYSGNDTLKAQVYEIAGLCHELFQVPYAHKFSQGDWLPRGHDGACWAFVLDWLRRSFKGKYGYSGAKIQKKMGAIEALQRDQLEIRQRGAGNAFVPGVNTVRIVNPDAPHARQDAYQGGYVTRDGHAAQRFNQRFDDMFFHPDYSWLIAPEEQRCYGIRAPGDASMPRLVGNLIMDFLRRDRNASLVNGDADNGWMLSLIFRDYFNNAGSTGHAIGIRFSADRRNAMYFDPNSGTGEIFLDMAHLWIDSVILEYSLSYAIESVSVRRVSVM